MTYRYMTNLADYEQDQAKRRRQQPNHQIQYHDDAKLRKVYMVRFQERHNQRYNNGDGGSGFQETANNQQENIDQ